MSSKQFTRQIFRWLRQINHDKRLRAIDLCVAVELTGYFNEKVHNGRAWPGLKTLGDAIGVHEVTVLKAVGRLAAAGHLRVVSGRQGRGYSNQYWMVPKPAGEQVKKPAARQVKKPAIQSRKPAARQEIYSRNHCSEDKSLRDLSSQGERDDPSGLGFPPPGAAAPDGAAPGEDQEPESSLSPTKTSPPSEPDSPEGLAEQGRRSSSETPPQSHCKPNLPTEGGFAELRRIWTRPWPDDFAAAGKAYAVAAAEVGADVILAGARAWVAACDAPRYLPALTNWLSARSWEVPPPQRHARSAPRQQTYHRRPKPELARMMLALGEED